MWIRTAWRQIIHRKTDWLADYRRPKYRVVNCDGNHPYPGVVKVEFYTWAEAVKYVNDHSLHIVEAE